MIKNKINNLLFNITKLYPKYIDLNLLRLEKLLKKLDNPQNNKGFTFAEIEAFTPIDGKKVTFTEGGKYNCRHEFVPV